MVAMDQPPPDSVGEAQETFDEQGRSFMQTVRRSGRPPKWPKEKDVERVVQFVRTGQYVETACAAVGLGKPTYYKWMRIGASAMSRMDEDEGFRPSEGERKCVRFINAVEKAMAESEITDLNRINLASQVSWQAAAWRLERRFPQRYAQRHEIKIGPSDLLQMAQEVAKKENLPVQDVLELTERLLIDAK
jgi:hypothetical protein